MANCVLLSLSGHDITLALDATQSALYNEEHGRRIAQLLSEHFGQSVELDIRIEAISAESPAAHRQRMEEEALHNARQEFENDEHVQALIKNFSAKIVPESVCIIKEAKI